VLRADLGASLTDLEWTVNAYNLAFACVLLTGAALGDRFGRQRVFATGIAVFTVASAVAALSPSVGVLIAARTRQGVGAAIVTPLTLTLISEEFPTERRGVAIGLWGGIAGLAVAAGPVVGGAVAGGISWQWIFWLNVPVGLLIIPLALRRLRESFGPRPQLDAVGLALAGADALGVTWGLVRANTVGWESAEILASLLAGLVLVGAFLAWERRAASPMIPLALFRDRGFATANAVSFSMLAALFGVLFLMAQFLQTALGHSPLQAGVRLLPRTAAPVVIAPLAGALADRYGNRPFMALGLALQATGLGWVAMIAEPGMGYGQLGVALTVAGVGISICFPTVANAVMGTVPLVGGRRRLRNKRHGARTRRRGRHRHPRVRLRRPSRPPIPTGVHRRLHAGTLARRDLLRPRRSHRDPPPDPPPAPKQATAPTPTTPALTLAPDGEQ
jgi:EmrB/QacA subfamily drug resistance transporter